MPVLKGIQAFRIEAVDALARRLAIQVQASGDGGCALAWTGAPDDLGTLDLVRQSGARLR